MVKRWCILLATLVFLSLTAGCNTTKGVGYKNPEYLGYALKKTAVYVDNLGEVGDALEAQIVSELNKRRVKAISVRMKARFAKSAKEFQDQVWAQDVNDILVIVMSDSRGTSVAGYQTWGSVNSYSYGGGSYGTTTTPVVGVHRSMLTEAAIYNRAGEKIWTGNTTRTASGMAFIGDELTVSETVTTLITALEKDKLVSQ